MNAQICYQTKRGAGVGKPVPLPLLESTLQRFAKREVECIATLNGEVIGGVEYTDCGHEGWAHFWWLAEGTP